MSLYDDDSYRMNMPDDLLDKINNEPTTPGISNFQMSVNMTPPVVSNPNAYSQQYQPNATYFLNPDFQPNSQPVPKPPYRDSAPMGMVNNITNDFFISYNPNEKIMTACKTKIKNKISTNSIQSNVFNNHTKSDAIIEQFPVKCKSKCNTKPKAVMKVYEKSKNNRKKRVKHWILAQKGKIWAQQCFGHRFFVQK